MSIATPLLPDPLTGSVWIGAPIPGHMYRIFLTASADNATINLTGQVTPNPSTGQLTAVFSNNPQLPFSALNVHFYGGPLAALANPESCGSFTTTSAITAYGSATATPSSSFNITGCANPTPFSPSFTAGTTNPTAGAYSPFTLTFSRSDSDKEFSSISATLPPGLFAKIAGVTQCSNAAAATGACPASSQVGTATVGSGAGSHPLFLSGQVYLTGPYKGGAYGLATVVPAVAGPYNLGTVVVRQALDINPTDAHVTAVSDPFPTILDGVPLRIKTINLNLNRPDFIINPTSCQPFDISATVMAVGGSTSSVASPFQVGSCAELPFNPKLGISLSGKGQTKTGRHPTLTATLTAPSSGQANLKTAKVTLPLSLALDPRNTQVVCSVADAAAIACPSNTIVGTASAISPLLPDPLSGNVYIVQGIRTNAQGQQIKTLPSLLIPLRGDIALNLQAQTSVDSSRPAGDDVPRDSRRSGVELPAHDYRRLHGILVITGGKNICNSKQIGSSVLGSQSGKTAVVEHEVLSDARVRTARSTIRRSTKEAQQASLVVRLAHGGVKEVPGGSAGRALLAHSVSPPQPPSPHRRWLGRTRSSWRIRPRSAPTSEVESMSCPSSTLCVAGSDGGKIMTSTDPTDGATSTGATWTIQGPEPSESILGMSCPSTSLCVGVDDGGNTLTSTDPADGPTAVWSVDPGVDGTNVMDGISCPSTSLCVAVDQDGKILTTTDPADGAAAHWAVSRPAPAPTTSGASRANRRRSALRSTTRVTRSPPATRAPVRARPGPWRTSTAGNASTPWTARRRRCASPSTTRGPP